MDAQPIRQYCSDGLFSRLAYRLVFSAGSFFRSQLLKLPIADAYFDHDDTNADTAVNPLKAV